MKLVIVSIAYLAVCMTGCKREELDIEDLERMANEDAVILFHENKLDYHYDSH